MEHKQNPPRRTVIHLRFLVFENGNKFKAICLDTNIANRADTFELLKQKILDSTLLYLRSFSEEEINNKEYIRRTSLQYYILWYTPRIARRFIRKSLHNEVEFDTSSGKLSFA
ncbi:MAG: hypothetical protein ACYCVH_06285 [Ignavibacteriaceae bacterium]